MITRTQLTRLINWIDEPEALIVLGPRQVGKTTLLKQLIKWLKKEKNVKDDQILFFNLDLEKDKQKLNSQQSIIDHISTGKKYYVFIDEIQRLNEPGLFIKGLIDTYPNIKFILSGSSSLEIKSKVSDVLTGRKKVIKLLPLSIAETDRYQDNLQKLLLTGGYPGVFTTAGHDKKIERLNEILESYLAQDIEDFIGIELIESYRKLLVLLADQIGQLVNISSLSNKLNLHFNTVDRYLSVLQNTFLVDLVYPFSTKPSVEIVKSPIPYFIDTGLRNSILGKTANLSDKKDAGALFENLIYLELKRIIKTPFVINFWRTKNQREVDFILTNRIKYLPIEAKYKNFEEPEITTSMKNFIENYKPDSFIVVNQNLTTSVRWGSALVEFITIDKLPTLASEFMS